MTTTQPLPPTDGSHTSTITERLVDMLRSRAQTGKKKYGTTLDRTDLSPRDWIMHTIEELLDGAGYLLCLDRDMEQLEAENQRLRTENERMSAALRPLLELAQAMGLAAPAVAPAAPVAAPVVEEEPIILTNDKMIGSEPAPSKAPTGLTRSQIAKAIDCNPNSCSKWEKEGIIARIPGTGTNPQNPALYPENTLAILLAHRAATEEKMRSVGYATGLKNIKPVKPAEAIAPALAPTPVPLNMIMGSPRDPMGLVRAAKERGWQEILIGFNAKENTLVAAAVGPLPPYFTLACTVVPEAKSVMIPITANSIGRTIGESIKDAVQGARKAGL